MLTDKVYDDLRDKILNLSLKPGSPLSFSALSAQYNISVSPIRDALKRLSSEGLIEIKPQSGTLVSQINLEKVRDERFMRLYLELGAIEKLGKLIEEGSEIKSHNIEGFTNKETSKKDSKNNICKTPKASKPPLGSLIEKWEVLIEKQNEAFSCRDTARFLFLDDQMHKTLFEATGHEKVFDAIRNTSGNYHRIRMVSYLFDDILKNILVQHAALLQALKNGDIDKFLALDRKHISKIEIETASYQKAYPQYFV